MNLHVIKCKNDTSSQTTKLKKKAVHNSSGIQIGLEIDCISPSSKLNELTQPGSQQVIQHINSEQKSNVGNTEEVEIDNSKNKTETLETVDGKEHQRHLKIKNNAGPNKTRNGPKHQQRRTELKNAKLNKSFHYKKRSGTSGLNGQLYETKLISLILFRALYVEKVNKFLIATNVDGLGAFDDIVFRYHSDKDGKPRIMFIQAKHRDNPAKDKLTVEEVSKVHGDFSLHKYLESYMKICQMFVPENNDDMFRGEFKNMDCEFLIYTSAFENFTKKLVADKNEGERFLKTCIAGKIFKFDYDDEDVESLLQTVAKSRSVLLAKRLSKFIFKDNYGNMMLDDLIKTYHVFLMQNVLYVEVKKGESQNNFMYAKFRESFFASNANLLADFKSTIYKEVSLVKKISSENQAKIEDVLKSLSFKVPANFGNVNFLFQGSEQKKKRRLDYLGLKFKKLFEIARVDVSTKNLIVKVDDDMVGPNEILQSTDLETYRLGGLVGNLLILDEETNTLKFNTDESSLSEDNLKLHERLTQEVNIGTEISKVRLDINVHRFPRLSLVLKQYDEKLIKDFLNKLTFYTNQSTEDEVEIILKEEIDKYFVSNVIGRQKDALVKLQSDAIFLKVHDRVQKWWKHPNKSPYLTNTCDFFVKSKQDILNRPLLSTLNFTYIKSVKYSSTEYFKDTAIDFLDLDGFLSSTATILSIASKENVLSSIKLIQYFKNKGIDNLCFIDLNTISVRNCFENVRTEIKESQLDVLIIVSKNDSDLLLINSFTLIFQNKMIIISNWGFPNTLNEIPTENIIKKMDNKVGFQDLADEIRGKLIKERNVVFQGKEVPLGVLLQNESYHLMNANVLYKILNDDKVVIGNCLYNSFCDEILDYYVKEKVCRYITIDANVCATDELNILRYVDVNGDIKLDSKDIVFIADKYEEFVEFIDMYKTNNVHWFSSSDDHLVWRQSRGSLQNLSKHIQRGSHDAYTLQPVTLKDFREKVVIISGEPGMGKSSLLTQLAINTKNKYPELWISKISLLNNINEFKRWQCNKVNIDVNEVIKFLFRILGFEASKGPKEQKNEFENIVNRVCVSDDKIQFDKIEAVNVPELSLLEIELFIYYLNHGQVALLFDGFDEICPDFANEFIQLANVLKKLKSVHLCVTSRMYKVLDQLENALETFSFTIQYLSYDDQLDFLENIWSRRSLGNSLMRLKIEGFLRELSEVLRDLNKPFINVPLHLFMISKIFQGSFESFSFHPNSRNIPNGKIYNQNTLNKVNLNQMYEQFVDVKFFKIRFGEKKTYLCNGDPDMRKLVDNERLAFLNMHKKIAAYVLFGKTSGFEFFDKRDRKEIFDYIKGISVGEEKTGIIEKVVGNEPEFVHFTFAEYFAVEFLWERLLCFDYGTYPWVYLFNNVLQTGEGGVRRFFNAKLGNNPVTFNAVQNEELNVIFETLLIDSEKLATMLRFSSAELLEYNIQFLLKCVRNILNKTNLVNFINVVSKISMNVSCLVCTAVDRSAISSIKLIIEMIKDIDVTRLVDLFNCCDLPKTNPLLKAYYHNGFDHESSINNFLLTDLPPSIVLEVFCIEYDINENNHKSSLLHLISSKICNKEKKD